MRKRKKKAAKKMGSFADFLASGGLEKIKKALFNDDGRIPLKEVGKMNRKKMDEVIERLFAVLTEDKDLRVVDIVQIAISFTDYVRAAKEYLVDDMKADEFAERGWKVMQARRLDREPAKG